MLNTPTHRDIQRFALASRAAEVEEKLPITEDARNGLSSFGIGLIGALIAALVIGLVQLIAL